MKNMLTKLKENKIVIGVILFSIAVVLSVQLYGIKDYARYNADSLHYLKGTVVEITDNSLTLDKGLGIYLGSQKLSVSVEWEEGDKEVIEVTNYLTKTHNVLAKVNTDLIINADMPKEVEAYYTVYNYDRSIPTLSCIIVLAAAVICVGKGKGIKSIAGLLYSMFLILYLLIPSVFSGYSPIGMSILCAVLSTAVTLLLLNGESKKTYAAILSTIAGVICSLILFLIMSLLLHLDGFSTAEAEDLLLIQQSTGLQIKDVLFAGILISSLGAIMDVGMSVVSALYELRHHNKQLSAKELFTSGIEIGKDMIGTMTNTLILAFTGSAFVTLLVFQSYQVQMNQLLNSNYLSIEIAQGVCGTFGIVLTVPIASAVAALLLTRNK